MDEIPFHFLRKLVLGTRIIKSLKPASQKRLYGSAFTVRVTDDSFKAQLAAIDSARPGDIIVCVVESSAPAWNPFLSKLSEKKHISGAVIDGTAEAGDSFPVYARDFVEFDPFREHVIDTKQRSPAPDFSPVEIDNCRIERGDILTGEGNEIVVVSRWDAAEIAGRYGKIGKVKKERGRTKVLDDKDEELLALLSKDSRAKLEDLSKALGISPGTVTYRMKKLEKRGVIKGYTVDLNYSSLGFGDPTFIVVWSPPGEIEGIAEKISSIKGVIEVHMVGMDELLIKVLPRDRTELLSVLERVNRMDKVSRVSSLSSLKTFKEKASAEELLKWVSRSESLLGKCDRI